MRRISSPCIFMFIKDSTGLKDVPIYKLLDLNDNSGQRFKNGLRKKGKPTICWWPNHESWYDEFNGITALRLGIAKLSSPVKSQQFPPPPNPQQAEQEADEYELTFESMLYEVLMGIYKKQLHGDFEVAKKRLINIAENMEMDIQALTHQKSIEDLFTYVIQEARNAKGTPYEISELGPSAKASFYTYLQLKKYGYTALDIATQLIENDRALYPEEFLAVHGGAPELWADHIMSAPENWGFLVEEDTKQIVGNYSFALLDHTWASLIEAGEFLEGNFDVSMRYDPLCSSTDGCIIYLLNMSTNDQYQDEILRAKLWAHFCNRLFSLAENGVFITGIYTNPLNKDRESVFKSRGFKHFIQNRHGGEVYHLDLSAGFPKAFTRNLPNLDLEKLYFHFWKKHIHYRQLTYKDLESLDGQKLSQISDLIFETDQYISAAMFQSQTQANCVLSHLLEANTDAVFALDNLFIAELGRSIVGIILHKKKPFTWSAEPIRRIATEYNEVLPDTLEKVEQEYFPTYKTRNAGCSVILNCCVERKWRNGMRLGTSMMAAFLEEHTNEIFTLHVLEETPIAVRLYRSHGFQTIARETGFSVDNRELHCLFMQRPAKAK